MSPKAAGADAFPESVARLCAALGGVPPGLGPALGRLDWAMALPSGSAPGFVYLAGACLGRPVGGGGADLAEAAGRLAGEASEVLAQDVPPELSEAPCLPALTALWGAGPRMAAWSVTAGRIAGAPMAAAFPGAALPEAAPPRSLGLAAGPDAEAARMAGLLELIERDAAAGWWNGAARPRAVGAAEAAEPAADLARLRAGATGGVRPTAFLALPSATGLPVVCALSRDAGGRGLAFGFKAATDTRTALFGAMRELLQMEIGLEIARLRASQGREAPGDAGPLARASLDPDAFDAFAPLPPDSARAPSARTFSEAAGLVGGEVIVADLASLPGGLAVAKVFATNLAPLPGPGAPPRPGAPGTVAALM